MKTALAIAALVVSVLLPAHADAGDDFMDLLAARGISLHGLSPRALGRTVCLYMKEGHSLIQSAYALSTDGIDGVTFSGPDAADIGGEGR